MGKKTLMTDIKILNKLAKGLIKTAVREDIKQMRELVTSSGICRRFVTHWNCDGCKLSKVLKGKCYAQDAVYTAKRFLRALDKELDDLFLKGGKL